jgi:citronellol/citronellal dehydrogenase
MTAFSGKTVLISGGSRGIGKAIALKLAASGANIVIAAKTTVAHPSLEGTIYSAAEEIINAGGKALAVPCDIRNEEQVDLVIEQTATQFGGIDILINNASAIQLYPSEMLTMKQYDLMLDINTRGAFMLSKKCLPFLKKSENAHILTLSPPINLSAQWFAFHTAYTISKYSMSMVSFGLAEEFRKYKVASNSLWPATLIGTAAVQNLLGGNEMVKRSRKPQIVADAAYFILQEKSETTTGNFFIDEEVLKKHGVSDFTSYAVDPKEEVMKDLFLE